MREERRKYREKEIDKEVDTGEKDAKKARRTFLGGVFGYSIGCFGRAQSYFNFARCRHLRQELTARGLLSRNFCGAAVWCGARGVSLKFANARWDEVRPRARVRCEKDRKRAREGEDERQQDRVRERRGRKTETKHDTPPKFTGTTCSVRSCFWKEHLVPNLSTQAGQGEYRSTNRRRKSSETKEEDKRGNDRKLPGTGEGQDR